MKIENHNNKPIQAIYDGMARDSYAAFSEYLSWSKVPQLESPIEELFYFGLLAKTVVDSTPMSVADAINKEKMESWAHQSGGDAVYELIPQFKVNKYRIDFVISCYCASASNCGSGEVILTSCVAVECDGFKFHHGDPEKAASDKKRDRDLSEHFDAIIRFTGTELNADPYACAKETFRILEAKLHD